MSEERPERAPVEVAVGILIGAHENLIPVVAFRQARQDGKRSQNAEQEADNLFHVTSPR